MEVTSEELISFAEAKKILDNRADDKELGYEQNNALEYLKKFSKLSGKKVKDMFDGLGKVTKLKDRHKIQIINFLPEDADDVRLLFAHEILNLSDEERKTVASIVKKFT